MTSEDFKTVLLAMAAEEEELVASELAQAQRWADKSHARRGLAAFYRQKARSHVRQAQGHLNRAEALRAGARCLA